MREFYDYDKQIDKLKNSDGLIIDDELSTIEYLRLEGYYNVINGYARIFKLEKKFIKGVKFENIRNLYEFDKMLRSIVYKYTSSIECHIKALLAHEFSRVHGVDEKEYLQPSSFTSNKNSQASVERLIEECNKTIKDATDSKSNKYRKYIAHSLAEHGHVPMWILVRALSFGTVSIFYKNMRESEKNAIAQFYHVSSDKLANILEVVVSFRNIVAHGERTFCAKLPKTRLSTKLRIAEKLSIAKKKKINENKFGRNDFLALLICCKYMLPAIEYDGFINELIICFEHLARVQNPSMVGRIKIEMGLANNNWKKLPKFEIDDDVYNNVCE